MNALNLSGQKFGRLTVVRYEHSRKGHRVWLCNCDCGKTALVPAGYLGHKRSCGCLHADSVTKHGYRPAGKRYPEYNSWISMKGRCLNPSHPHFEYWGGRGITFCERWNKFENFLSDMGPKPEWADSIDRYPDNNGNYEPGNCRWATAKQQVANRRKSSR